MEILVANSAHTAQIKSIYQPFIEHSLVTFETEIPDDEAFEARILQYGSKFPWLVMVDGDTVAGYAYASPYRERVAYQWAVECSVYVHPGHQHKGIAGKLYKTLFELLKLQGIYKVFAVITVPNPESIGFHEKNGFKWFATYKNIGYKSGKWCDVGWWELILKEPGESSPTAPVPFTQLDPEVVKNILKK